MKTRNKHHAIINMKMNMKKLIIVIILFIVAVPVFAMHEECHNVVLKTVTISGKNITLNAESTIMNWETGTDGQYYVGVSWGDGSGFGLPMNVIGTLVAPNKLYISGDIPHTYTTDGTYTFTIRSFRVIPSGSTLFSDYSMSVTVPSYTTIPVNVESAMCPIHDPIVEADEPEISTTTKEDGTTYASHRRRLPLIFIILMRLKDR